METGSQWMQWSDAVCQQLELAGWAYATNCEGDWIRMDRTVPVLGRVRVSIRRWTAGRQAAVVRYFDAALAARHLPHWDADRVNSGRISLPVSPDVQTMVATIEGATIAAR